MAPKAKRRRRWRGTADEGGRVERPPASDPAGMFRGMVVYFVPEGVQLRRLQIWKQKLLQMGGMIEQNFLKKVSHVLALGSDKVLCKLGPVQLKGFKGDIVHYDWLENCLKSGKRLSTESYNLEVKPELAPHPMTERGQSEDLKISHTTSGEDRRSYHTDSTNLSSVGKSQFSPSPTDSSSDAESPYGRVPDASTEEPSLLYNPPDLNRNITEIFGKLIHIYRALGDERRSFSYYKAIPVIEKLPFKIESVDQVKHLPAIGKSMQDHIHEIVTTGKLSKLEHFEKDEKARTVSLFGEVWGIGPATALKLYEKGYRSLQDLEKEDSLTDAQRVGLKYFNDIKEKIPRHEVQEMERLIQKAGEAVLPGVEIVFGGSYKRGKAFCGDMDVVITHPDGKSHRGFLPKFIPYLKDINFLREDLVYSIHSVQGTNSGVDTYFGLCTYPGREKRHRIDFKVYPRDIYAFGLIAWTGNDVLNRRLRLIAESKGYRLDDTGLFLATQSSGRKRGMKCSTLINCKTEKEVFDLLGFPWLEPHERNL